MYALEQILPTGSRTFDFEPRGSERSHRGFRIPFIKLAYMWQTTTSIHRVFIMGCIFVDVPHLPQIRFWV